VGTSKRTAIHDPRGVSTAQTGVDAGEGSMLSEVGVVGNRCSKSVCGYHSLHMYIAYSAR
jgi:hypothetical protein